MTRPNSLFVRSFAALLAAALMGPLAPVTRAANPDLDYRVDTATEVLQDLRHIPENAIPPNLLSSAYAVAVVPSVLKASFFAGGSYGKGILVVRRADGQWSNPAFVQLYAGSFGFQFGAQSTDLVLVFKTQRALEGISRGKITFGGDASVAAGPVGREVAAATDLQMQTEIYSYARTRGLFAGVSAQGAWLRIDSGANAEYYDGSGSNAMKILTDATIPAPASARRFTDTLAATAPPLSNVPTTRSATRDPDMEAPPPAGAKTFGVEDSPATPAESKF